VQGVWAHICKILKIEQRLSTAYHPETDGQTERMNQTLEEYLRHFCTYYQEDWDTWLPMAEAAINTRTAASTGVSLFFLSHGYHPQIGEGIDFPLDNDCEPRNLVESAQQIISKWGNHGGQGQDLSRRSLVTHTNCSNNHGNNHSPRSNCALDAKA